MQLRWSLPLCLALLICACQRNKPLDDWEIFVPVHPAGPGRAAPVADPEAPSRLQIRESGPAGEPLVFLQDRGGWLLLDAEARQVFYSPAPAPPEDGQPARVAAAFFSARLRSVFVLYQQDLHVIPLEKPALGRIASLGAGPLCSFAPPFEQHVLQDGDLGEDPDKKALCAVLRDSPEPDTHRACNISINPEDGAVKSVCVKDDGHQAERPVEPPVCSVAAPLTHAPAASGWSPDETACAIRQDTTGKVVALMPDEDEPSSCRIQFEGRSADGRFAIWCVSDPEPEYAGQRCRVVDLQRARLLEPSVDLPVETHVRWDASARAALVGDFLFLLQGSPVRFVELNATALFVR